MNRKYVTVILLVAFSLLSVSNAITAVTANVPSIIQIDNISQGSSGRIKVQITHLNPSPSHYVDQVEVDVNGNVMPFSLQPQSGNPFTVEFDVGALQGTPNVRVRSHCSVHGWSPWSNQVQIPEYTQVGLTIIAALVASLLVMRRITRK